MSSLYFGDQMAAGEFNLQSDTVLHGWITAFDQTFSKYSPGNMLVQDVLSQMTDAGMHLYDSGPGLDHYKRHYSNAQIAVESGVLAGNSTALNPARVAGQVWRLGEQVMPRPASAIMARVRRRMDQIAAVDTSLTGRASGLISALQNRPV